MGDASKNGGDAKLDSAASFDEECGQRDAANQTHESRKTHRIKGDQAMAVNYRPLTLSCFPDRVSGSRWEKHLPKAIGDKQTLPYVDLVILETK